MTINAVKDAILDTGSQSYTDTRAAFSAGMILPLISASDVTAFNSMDNAAESTPYKAVHYSGSVYAYDSTDTTSSHDPAGGVIVDGSGRRYIRDTSTRIDRIVLDKDLATPPGSPSFGDAYFVATSATGAWAGQDGDLAYYTDRGWIFEAITEGMVFYVIDETQFYYVNGAGGLAQFPGAAGLAADSVEIKHLESPFGVVVEAEQDAPPGSPSGLVKYIVVGSPSGDWSSDASKIAQWETSAWVFYTPKSGDIVFDKDAGYLKRYSGSSWTRAVDEQPFVDNALVDVDADVTSGLAISSTLQDHNLVTVSITGSTDQRVVIDIGRTLIELTRGGGSNVTPSEGYFYVKRDAEVVYLWSEGLTLQQMLASYYTALDQKNSRKVITIISDGSAHDYHFGIRIRAGSTDTFNVRLTLDAHIRRYTGTVVTS
jgi:hypothetical protein